MLKAHDNEVPKPASSEMTKSQDSTPNEMESHTRPESTGLRLVPIMVVADLEPRPTAEEQLTREPAGHVPARPSTQRTPPSRIIPSLENLTPPKSSNGSPPARNIALDRTSLLRRREWNANRARERQAREASMAAEAKAKLVAASERLGETVKPLNTDKEILKLYGSYRDQRFREMERRVRRLERNGDVWLRALVPVLDDVNQTTAPKSDEQGRTLGWDLANGQDGNVERRSRSAMGRPERGDRMASRRSSLSQGRLLEQLARKADEGESWEGSGKENDDMTGFETIEPLMRELAGEASRRRKAAERLGVSGDAWRGRRVL